MTSHFPTYFFILLLVLAGRINSHAQEVMLTCDEPTGCAPHGIIINAIAADGSLINNPQWTVTGPSGNTLQSVVNPYVAIFNQPGTYDIVVSANGITHVFENYITVFARPQAIISTTDGQGCLPFCTTLLDVSTPGSGAIVSRSWDFGDGETSSEENPNHCYEQIGVYTPVLAIEDENGCFASISAAQLVTVTNNFPVSSFTIGSQNSCYLPTAIEFTANSAPNIAHHTWIVNDQVMPEGSSIQEINFNTSGAYEICLAVENTIGCVDTSCQTITVSDDPEALFTLNNDTICAGQTISFNNQSVPPPSSTEWDLNGNGTVDATQTNPSFTYSTAGTYVITMTAHFGNACSVSVQDTLFVEGNPTIDFTGSNLVSCAPPLTSVFTNNEAFNPAFTYIWTVNGGLVANTHNLSYTFTEYGAHDVKLRRINQFGCERSRNKNNFVIIDSPEISFDYEEYYCVGENAVVSNITTEAGETIIDYSWDFNGDGEEDAIGPNPTYTFEEAGEFYATLTATLASGCVSIDTTDTPLTVLESTIPGFSVSVNESCAGETFVFCTEFNADNTYTWDFHDGTSPELMLAVDSCVTHLYEDTGYFDVTLTVFNGACNTFYTIEDYIHVVPPLALFEFDVVCENFTAHFQDLSIGGDSLVWDFGDGSPFVINESNPTHSYAEPGQYSVVLSAFKDGSLCYDTKVLQVAVAAPSADILLAPSIGCAPLSVAIDTEASNDVWEITIENGDRITVQRNDNPFADAWSIAYEHNGQIDESTSNDPTSFDWPNLLVETAGTYDVHVSVIDAFGCAAETTYTDAIVVWPSGDFSSFTAQVVNACDSGGVVVRAEALDANAASWSWSFSDGAVANSQIIEHRFDAPFNYNAGISCSLLVADTNGCASSRNFTFDAVLPAQPAFNWQAPPVCRNENVLFLNNSLAPTGTTYEWSFGDGNHSVEADSINHAYTANGNYAVCLTAINSVGCATSVCTTSDIAVYSPVAEANFTTQLNTCLFAVTLENTSVEGGAYTWWDFGDNQTGVGDTILHTYPIGVYDVQLVVGAANGCADTLVIEDILNYSSSVGPFTQVLDTANCAPFGVTFQAFNPNDQYFDYFWDFNDGNGDPFGGTASAHAYMMPGSYCPSIIMTDPNGCDVYIPCTDTIVVENYASTAIIPENICATSEAEIVIQHADSFVWDHPWVHAGAGANTLLVRADSSFSFALTSSYSDCVHTQTIFVDVLPLPQVQLALVDSVCANTGLIPLMGGVPEGGQYTLGNINTNTLNTNLFSGENATFVYHFTGANGCSNTAVDSIYVITPPSVEPLVGRDFCEGDNPATFVNDSFSYYTFDGVVSDMFTPVYTGSPTAVVRHVYDTFGCHNSASTEYRVHAKPTGVIQAPSACTSEEVSIVVEAVVAGSELSSITWVVDGDLEGEGHEINDLVYDIGGQHTVGFNLQSMAGCASTIDTIFMVYDTPNAQFSSSVACEKDTTLLTDLSTFGNDSINTWVWSFEGIQLNSAGDTAIVFANPGNTALSLQVSTIHGCTHTSTRNIIVRYAPVIEANANNHCFGIPTVFESVSSIPEGGVVSTYWTIEAATFVMQGAQAGYQFQDNGIYNYTFTAESNFGCTSSITDSVEVFAIPVIALPEGTYEYCENQLVGISASATTDDQSSISSFTWAIDGEVVSQTNPAQFELSDIGAYVLEVVATTNHGCVGSFALEQPVVVYPTPTAGFTWSIDQMNESPTVLVSSTSSADVVQTAYNWGDGSGDEMESHQYAGSGSFEITQVVTNSFGCNAYHSEPVEVYNGIQFYIPSAFTPDLNNHNELFLPVLSGSNVTYYVFRVFNRWGNEVFTSTTPGEGWDGYFKGEPVQDGAYNWSVDMIVRGRQDLFSKKGSVLLMR